MSSVVIECCGLLIHLEAPTAFKAEAVCLKTDKQCCVNKFFTVGTCIVTHILNFSILLITFSLTLIN